MSVARVRHLLIAACAGIGILVATRAAADTDATSARIYNGVETTAYPAVVAVGVLNSDGSGGLCSGTLIAPTVVLTAGHCLSLDPVAAAVAIFPDGVTEVDIDAARWEVHPNFDVDRVAVDDVAVVVLERPVTDVEPLPLVATAPRPRSRAAIVGFGDAGTTGVGIKRAGRVRLTRVPARGADRRHPARAARWLALLAPEAQGAGHVPW
jgi:secreted trypsin-like serine protease